MQITRIVTALQGGDRDAMHAVIPLVYEELKKLARSHLRRERRPFHYRLRLWCMKHFLNSLEAGILRTRIAHIFMGSRPG